MKRIASIAFFILLATTATAGTIKWGASGAAYYGNTLLKNDGSTYAYLVYLGENVSSWDSFSFKDDFEESRLASKQPSALGSTGTGNTFSVTEGAALNGLDHVTALLTDKKSSFGVLFVTKQEGNDYYYLGDVFTYDTTSTSYTSATSTYTATSTASPTRATTTSTARPDSIGISRR